MCVAVIEPHRLALSTEFIYIYAYNHHMYINRFVFPSSLQLILLGKSYVEDLALRARARVCMRDSCNMAKEIAWSRVRIFHCYKPTRVLLVNNN